jgi:hypothetical protein
MMVCFALFLFLLKIFREEGRESHRKVTDLKYKNNSLNTSINEASGASRIDAIAHAAPEEDSAVQLSTDAHEYNHNFSHEQKGVQENITIVVVSEHNNL